MLPPESEDRSDYLERSDSIILGDPSLKAVCTDVMTFLLAGVIELIAVITHLQLSSFIFLTTGEAIAIMRIIRPRNLCDKRFGTTARTSSQRPFAAIFFCGVPTVKAEDVGHVFVCRCFGIGTVFAEEALHGTAIGA